MAIIVNNGEGGYDICATIHCTDCSPPWIVVLSDLGQCGDWVVVVSTICAVMLLSW